MYWCCGWPSIRLAMNFDLHYPAPDDSKFNDDVLCHNRIKQGEGLVDPLVLIISNAVCVFSAANKGLSWQYKRACTRLFIESLCYF